jgi:hypothetical protein
MTILSAAREEDLLQRTTAAGGESYTGRPDPEIRSSYTEMDSSAKIGDNAQGWECATTGLLAMDSEAIRREFEQSTLYRIMERKARLDVGRKILLTIGEKRFGPADVIVRAAVNAIAETRELERLCVRACSANSWAELFTPPDEEVAATTAGRGTAPRGGG